MMRVGSLFTGIGGFDESAVRAGAEIAWQSEIDKSCRKILMKRFPETPLFGDIRELHGAKGECNATPDFTADPGHLPDVDALCGGFPCQDISVAGRRAGLAGERSGLFFEFARIAAEVSARWVCIENVPGLLSSVCPCPGDQSCGDECERKPHQVAGGICEPNCMAVHGGAMGVILTTLAQLGYSCAWRVFDAQYFGVPQRRRRVFIVGHLDGDGRRAAEVLFEPESCDRHPATIEASKSRVAAALADRARSGRRAGLNERLAEIEMEVAGTLGGGTSKRGWHDDLDRAGAFIAETSDAASIPRGTWRGADDPDRTTFVITPESSTKQQPNSLVARETDTAEALTQTGPSKRSDRGTVIVSQTAATLSTANNADPKVRPGGRRKEDDENVVVLPGQTMRVRRLMPIECERLQGFDDEWTEGASDMARYQMLGNAVPIPVSEWLWRRLIAVDLGVAPGRIQTHG